MAKRGLGKGLSALIPGAFRTEAFTVEEISINQITANAKQPRKFFDQKALDELSDSIKSHGIMQPLVVRKTDDGYQLIAGERRFRAAKQAGLTVVPAVIKKTSESESMQLALIENIQREDLSAIEEAKAYCYLIEDCNFSQAKLAQKIGKSREAIANTIRLLQLPAEIQKMVEQGKISPGHGRALLSLKDAVAQQQAAEQIVNNNLSVRQAEGMASFAKSKIIAKKKEQPQSYKATAIKLGSFLDAKIKVENAGNKGMIKIEFKNELELERIFNLIMSE